ncbi:MAG: hypothetical protein Kow00121_43290 [Elainellaceae cyanobacterium]
MLTKPMIQVREATPQEDGLIAEHFYQMWQDNGVPTEAIQPDWRDITLQFIEQARQCLKYQAFVAIVEGGIIGSSSCQLHAGLYPDILQPGYRQYGYVWGVFVEPSYRKQGIASQLTQQTIDYLKSIGCTRVILNASPFGKPVYDRLGFVPGNVMQLDV